MRKVSIIVLLIALLVVSTGCNVEFNGKEIISMDLGFDGNPAEKSEVITQKVDSQTRLSVSNTSGKIEMKPWDKDEIQVTAVKKIRAAGDEKRLQELLKELKINIDKRSTTIDISVEHIRGNISKKVRQQTVDMEIMVPQKMAYIMAKVTSGEIEFYEFKEIQQFELHATSGRIVAENSTAQKFDIEMTSGDLDVYNVRGNGAINMTSGKVMLKDLSGDISFKATSGDIDIDGFEGKINSDISSGSTRVRAAYLKSSSSFFATSGEIYVEAEKLDSSGNYEFNASSGDISICIPADTEFNVESKASSGRVSSDFTLTKDYRTGDNRKKNEIKGVVGDGGPNINIFVTSGEVKIRKK